MIDVKMRKWTLVTLSLFFCFLLESSLFPWLIPQQWRSELLIYPKLILVGVVYIGMFSNRHTGGIFGVAFGLLQDMMFYGHMLGVNSFTYALCGYVAGMLIRPRLVSFAAVFLIQLSCLLLYETSLYGFYRLFNIIEADFGWMFINGMLPSMLISLFLALALYIPVRKGLEFPVEQRDSNEE